MRLRITAVVIGMALGAAAPAAQAQLTVANDCTIPTTGTNTAPNQPCWAAGVYNGDYTGTNDVDYVGAPAQVVGGHPFTGVTDFTVGNLLGIPDGTVKDIRVDIPPGLVSDPLATPTCSDAALSAGTCPADTQLGIVKLEANLLASFYAGASVYNMPVESSHCSGYVSDYAFTVPVAGRVDICGSVNRQPPYNLYFKIVAPPGAATVSSTLIFWGVPGDSGHNPQRGWKCGLSITPCVPPATSPGTASGTAFLTNPTACLPAGQPSTLTLTPTSGSPVTTEVKTPVGAIDCSSLAFSPALSLQLKGANQVKVGKHPTVVANLNMAPGQANIATSQVTLPLSLALDPTNSQQVCADAAAYVDNCPSNTLVGSAVATTPILGVPLSGPAYLVQGVRCASGQPTLQGTCPSGIPLKTEPWLLIELRGGGAAIDLHAVTSVVHNKLVTTFFNLPDLPESTFQLTINGGKRGILVVTGNKSLCSYKKQIAPTLFTAQNGKTKRANLKITTPCKKH